MNNGINRSMQLLTTWLDLFGFRTVPYRNKLSNKIAQLFCWVTTVTHCVYWAILFARKVFLLKLGFTKMTFIPQTYDFSDVIIFALLAYYRFKFLAVKDRDFDSILANIDYVDSRPSSFGVEIPHKRNRCV